MKKRYGENKVNITLWTLTVISALIAIISYSFLPKDIPMQWSGLNVNWYADKLAIFMSPLMCLVIICLLKPEISKRFKMPVVSDIITVCLMIIFLTCELYTIAYCFGLRYRLDYILLAEVIIMVIIGTAITRSYYRNKS
ncbi:MAG: DUF1648 domain-containing protein [Caldicoprobacterales bacterium]|jgi:uncharacterized membrane protein|nr:DUF1648 domain-containing protein [Clostridiales bacterium]